MSADPDRRVPRTPTASRELVVLGTSAQTPTLHRSQNSAALRWNGHLVVFDPGEGTQLQLARAGMSAAKVTAVCLTHFHGDHCLGLPGLVQRRALSRPPEPLTLCYPAWGAEHVDRLLYGNAIDFDLCVRHRPVADTDTIRLGEVLLHSRPLDHTAPAVGWRLEEPARPHLLPDRLAAEGIEGPAIGRLQREGSLDLGDHLVEADELSEIRPGRSFAFVMDTRVCQEAVELARGVDLVVCEATYLEEHAHLAAERGHLTARQAAGIAREAGARQLVMSHFSERYPHVEPFETEARTVFAASHAAHDLDRFPIRAPS